MTVIKESYDLVPLGPHCESPLREVMARAVDMRRGEEHRSGSASGTSTLVPPAGRRSPSPIARASGRADRDLPGHGKGKQSPIWRGQSHVPLLPHSPSRSRAQR